MDLDAPGTVLKTHPHRESIKSVHVLFHSHHIGPLLNNSSIPAIHSLNINTYSSELQHFLLHIYNFQFPFLLSVSWFLTFTLPALLLSECQPFLPLHDNIPPLQTPTFQHPNIHSHQITLISFKSPNLQIFYNYIFSTFSSKETKYTLHVRFYLPSIILINTITELINTLPPTTLHSLHQKPSSSKPLLVYSFSTTIKCYFLHKCTEIYS